VGNTRTIGDAVYCSSQKEKQQQTAEEEEEEGAPLPLLIYMRSSARRVSGIFFFSSFPSNGCACRRAVFLVRTLHSPSLFQHIRRVLLVLQQQQQQRGFFIGSRSVGSTLAYKSDMLTLMGADSDCDYTYRPST